MKANEVKPGVALKVDGRLFVVLKTEHVKPGKGPAYVQVKMRALDGGGVTEKRLNSSESVDGATLDRREMEYLYTDGTTGTFMDTSDFDQIEMSEEFLGDALLYLTPNTKCTVLMHDSNPISIELPAAVDLEVKDTAPGIKGATATNQLKEAEMETGLKIRVPPFITNGERVKVSTADGSYLSRSKED
jgi:elongation factor P